MNLDFASEYAQRTDDELRLLIQDRDNLVDTARQALDAEVRKRRRNGFQLHVREPEEPRIHVEEDDDDVNISHCSVAGPDISQNLPSLSGVGGFIRQDSLRWR
jgi:hypothetical protein